MHRINPTGFTRRLHMTAAAMALAWFGAAFVSPAAMVCPTHAADSNVVVPKVIKPMEGLFRNETMKFEGHIVDGQLHGQITAGDQVARFQSQVKDDVVKLIVQVDNVESQYTATVEDEGNTLALRAGLQVFKLKRMTIEAAVGNLKLSPKQLVKSTDVVDAFLMANHDNTHVAFVQSREARRVFMDGQSGKSYFHAERLTFSADGKHLAYLAIDGDDWFVVKDGVAGPAFDEIKPESIRFSATGGRLGYIGVRNGRYHLVIDGKESAGHDECAGIVFSHDGKHVAFGIKQDGKWRNVIDGKDGKAATSVGPVVFSADGKHYAYGLVRGTQEFLITTGDAEQAVDGIEGIAFSPDGKRLATIIARGSHLVAVVDGQAGEPYNEITHMHFSDDGRRFAYRATREGRQYVVVDGVASEAFDQVGPPVLSPDGRTMAYAFLKKKKVHVSRNGIASKPYDMVLSLTFSPDSARLAFVAQQGSRWLVVVDDKPGENFDEVHESGPTFSPDSRHVAFIATRFGKRFLVANNVANLLAGAPIAGSRVVFDEPLLFHTIVRRGDEFLRVDAKLIR